MDINEVTKADIKAMQTDAGREALSEIDTLRARVKELEGALSFALDTIQWMTGSADFGPEGKAWKGWQLARPEIDKCHAILKQALKGGK